MLEDVSRVADLGQVRLLLLPLLVGKTNSLVGSSSVILFVFWILNSLMTKQQVLFALFCQCSTFNVLRILVQSAHLGLHHGHHVPEDGRAVWLALRRRLLPQLFLLLSLLHKSFLTGPIKEMILRYIR